MHRTITAQALPIGILIGRVVGAPLFLIGILLTIAIDRLGRRIDPADEWEPAPVLTGGRLWPSD